MRTRWFMRAPDSIAAGGVQGGNACRPARQRYLPPQHRFVVTLKGPPPMGFKQTTSHRFGKGSYHQIGLVRGQFGGVNEADWLQFIAKAGFDGWEEASWELDLRKCDTDEGAAAYAKERVGIAKSP